jgi:two-component system chemotaxis response regulator CheY
MSMTKCVLTVDDSKTIRDMVSFTLKNAGFEVMEAEDGQKALDAVSSRKPDLVITDLNMPNMDGLTLIQRLRSMPDYKTMPILMLTTEQGDDKKSQGRSVGATGWLVKPFDPDKLIQVIAKVCP